MSLSLIRWQQHTLWAPLSYGRVVIRSSRSRLKKWSKWIRPFLVPRDSARRCAGRPERTRRPFAIIKGKLTSAETDLHAFGLAYVGYGYGRARKLAEARAVLNKLESAARQTYISPYLLALLHTGLGEIEQAFDYLERARRERNPMLALIRVDPTLDPLRSESRFNELVQSMNFPGSYN